MKKKYIYLSIMGGIGDQIFQYSYASFLKKKFYCNVYLDISYYKSILNHNRFKFRLENLAKKNNYIITKDFANINYKYLSYLRLINVLGINKIFPYIYKFFFKSYIKNFIYEFWSKNKKVKNDINSYYYGYWHDLVYIKNLKKNISRNLINHHNNKSKLKKFIKNKIDNNTVAIHVRGGDFHYLPSHNILDKKYYNNSIKFFVKLLKKPKFHIFTNDIPLAKKLLNYYLKDCYFIFIKRYNFSDIEEFCLFSKYKYSIIANSTFGLLSTYLSYTRKMSFAPKIWLLGKKLEKKKKIF